MKNILITGASSGLGEEFAYQYAALGIKLFLCGRNAERLDHVVTVCREKGAEVEYTTIDVTDRSALSHWVGTISRTHGLDLIIANAGISGGFSGQNIVDIIDDYKVFDVNLTGILNTIYPALPDMVAKQSGHIVMISSMASFVPMPSAPAYSASKAGVRFYGEALRSKVAAYNIKVTVICPGFIKSRMTDANDFKMPFLMEISPAVEYMIEEISKGRARINFPWPMAFAMKFLTILPASLSSSIFAWLPDKKHLPKS